MRSDGSCRSCHAPIRWAVHEVTGKRMPLDPHPVVTGNVAVVEWRGGEPMSLPVVAVGKAIAERSITPYRYVSHFATCPNAKSHRR